MWILGNSIKDSLFILFPGFFCVILCQIFPVDSVNFLVFSFIVMAFIDTGHVYTTAWRTWLNPAETRNKPFYWMIPMGVFFLGFTWHQMQIPYLWTLVAYFTLFHHVRQFYGISRWYQKLNGSFCRTSSFFLYALCWIPIASFHFRPGRTVGSYRSTELFYYPNAEIFKIGLYLNLWIMIAWVLFEVDRYRNLNLELNRILSIGSPAFLYFWCAFLSGNGYEVILPLVMSHGVAYIAVMQKSLKNVNRRFFGSAYKAIGILIFTASVFGGLERILKQRYFPSNFEYLSLAPPFLGSMGIALFLTPLLCHYIFDAIIWKRKHRESSLIYAIH